MNYSTAIFLMSDAARGINVSYEQDSDGKGVHPYTLFKSLDQSLEKGDYVVVQTDTRHHMTVCRVEEVDVEPDFDRSAEVRWIVGRVELEDFDKLKAQEDAAIDQIKRAEKRSKREELRKKLEEMAGEDLKALPAIGVPTEDAA